jgi:hypothetical protein
MKTAYLKTTCFEFDQYTVKLFPIPQQRVTYYKFSITYQKETKNQYQSQQIYSTQLAAFLAAGFFCLRALLDRKTCPALIVDIQSGQILSINLPAFALLGIDAVGFNMPDFTGNSTIYEQICQELQQTGNFHQSISLCNADGHLIECTLDGQVWPHCSRWAIFCLRANHDDPILMN